MAASVWFSPRFRESVKRAVQDVERTSGAELVVAVRPSSGHYRDTDLAVGIVLALSGLCVFLYHPAPFDFTYLPLELGVLFGLGCLLSLGVPPLKRALTRRRLMNEAVETRARATFVELGVHRTTNRTGVLVLISSFERRVEIVADAGVPTRALGDDWLRWSERIERAVLQKDSEGLLAELRELGPLLSQAVPRSGSDQNELPDSVRELES